MTAEETARELYPLVYNLSLRMLMDSDDAADATQDIMISVLRALPSFRGESKLSTWAFSIASNHLISRKRSRDVPSISFEAFEGEVGAHLAAPERLLAFEPQSLSERKELEEELKVSCTMGMLQCLEPLDRLCFVLHAFFGLDSAESGTLAGLGSDAYRQRVSRSRKKMSEFMSKVCGLTGGTACSCASRLPYALACGRVPPGKLFLSMRKAGRGQALAATAAMEDIHDAASFFRNEPALLPPDRERRIRAILDEHSPPILNPPRG